MAGEKEAVIDKSTKWVTWRTGLCSVLVLSVVSCVAMGESSNLPHLALSVVVCNLRVWNEMISDVLPSSKVHNSKVLNKERGLTFCTLPLGLVQLRPQCEV